MTLISFLLRLNFLRVTMLYELMEMFSRLLQNISEYLSFPYLEFLLNNPIATPKFQKSWVQQLKTLENAGNRLFVK